MSKPVPFAEKKNARMQHPKGDILGMTEPRCDAKECASRLEWSEKKTLGLKFNHHKKILSQN
jgi:hypothetical protein